MSLSRDAAQDASSLEAALHLEGALHEDLYEEWKRHGKHWEEYASEMLGTAFLLFCVVGAVAFLFGSSAFLPRLIPSSALRLLLVGLLLGGASGLVALTPPGRLSGAHLNPAMSLGFWVLGKMHGAMSSAISPASFWEGCSGRSRADLSLGDWQRKSTRVRSIRDAAWDGPERCAGNWRRLSRSPSPSSASSVTKIWRAGRPSWRPRWLACWSV